LQKQNKILISLEIIKKAFRFGTLFCFKDARDAGRLQRVFHTLYPVLPISFVCVTKETGERKIRRSIAARLFSLRFSHRFQRIAKAQLIWYQPSADV